MSTDDTRIEPPVVETRADRESAVEALLGALPSGMHRSHGIRTWTETGNHVSLETSMSPLPSIAHAIARARTMAAFEATCRAVCRALENPDLRYVDVAMMLGLPMYYPDWWTYMRATDDDIRRLVLKGWGK